MDHCQRQKYRSMTLVSGSINHLYNTKAFLAAASSNLSGVAEIDEFAVFPLPLSSCVTEVTSALSAHYEFTTTRRCGFLPAPTIRMTWNELE